MATSSEEIDLLASGVFAHIRQNPINIPAEAPTDHFTKTPIYGPPPVERDPTFIMGQAGGYRLRGLDDKMPPGGAYHALAPMPVVRTYLAGIPLPKRVAEKESRILKYLDDNLYYVGNTAPDTTSDKTSADFQLQISGACAIRVDAQTYPGDTLIFRAGEKKEVEHLQEHGSMLQRANATAPVVLPLTTEYISDSFAKVLSKSIKKMDVASLFSPSDFKQKRKAIRKEFLTRKSVGDFTRGKKRQVENALAFIEGCLEASKALEAVYVTYTTNPAATGLIETGMDTAVKKLQIAASAANAHYMELLAHRQGRAVTGSQAGGAVLSVMR